jgi:hypothetical protein
MNENFSNHEDGVNNDDGNGMDHNDDVNGIDDDDQSQIPPSRISESDEQDDAIDDDVNGPDVSRATDPAFFEMPILKNYASFVIPRAGIPHRENQNRISNNNHNVLNDRYDLGLRASQHLEDHCIPHHSVIRCNVKPGSRSDANFAKRIEPRNINTIIMDEDSESQGQEQILDENEIRVEMVPFSGLRKLRRGGSHGSQEDQDERNQGEEENHNANEELFQQEEDRQEQNLEQNQSKTSESGDPILCSICWDLDPSTLSKIPFLAKLWCFCFRKPSREVVRLNCGHNFCKECIKNWAAPEEREGEGQGRNNLNVQSNNDKCPYCRTEYVGLKTNEDLNPGGVDNFLQELPLMRPTEVFKTNNVREEFYEHDDSSNPDSSHPPPCKTKCQRSLLPCRQGVAKCLWKTMRCLRKVAGILKMILSTVTCGAAKFLCGGCCSLVGRGCSNLGRRLNLCRNNDRSNCCSNLPCFSTCCLKVAFGVCWLGNAVWNVGKCVGRAVKKAYQYFQTEGTCGHSCVQCLSDGCGR